MKFAYQKVHAYQGYSIPCLLLRQASAGRQTSKAAPRSPGDFVVENFMIPLLPRLWYIGFSDSTALSSKGTEEPRGKNRIVGEVDLVGEIAPTCSDVKVSAKRRQPTWDCSCNSFEAPELPSIPKLATGEGQMVGSITCWRITRRQCPGLSHHFEHNK
jgi:hypothetical protein